MQLNISKLNSGLKVISYKMPEIKSAAISLISSVGSRFESEAENGISHFLEHMAFKGTKRRTARDIAEEFDSIGGHFNAYTSKEKTVYYSKVLGENVKTAMDITADIVQNSLYADEEIKKEYGVIVQEIANTMDDPDSLAHEKLYEVAYKDQPFGRSILGSKESIAKFTSKDFKKYTENHYHSSNLYLSVAGDIDHDNIMDLASKMFDLKSGEKAISEPAIYTGGSSIIEKPDQEHSTIVLAFESVPNKNKIDFFHAQMLSLILGRGMSSRLFQRIREDLGLSYSTGAYNSSYLDTGLFSLYAGTSHENLAQVHELLLEEKDKICESITTDELERCKAQIKASIVMAQENPAYKAEEIGKAIAIYGEYEGPEKTMEYINATTDKNIVDMAKRIFSSTMSLSVVTDKKDRIKV